MFMTVPTWRVYIEQPNRDRLMVRVPQTELDAFTRVLNFNRAEYEVKEEKLEDLGVRVPTEPPVKQTGDPK